MNILVIEDDSTTHELIKTILSAYNDVVIEETGMAGIERFTDAMINFTYFDVVMVDLGLPDIDGTYTLKLLKRFEKVKAINSSNQAKIIAMTATADENKVKECLMSGCSGFIIKPVTKENLNKALSPYGVKVYF